MYLSDHAAQKGFVFLQMATEQADPPRVENARDVVPLLQEQPARCIEDNSCCNPANARGHCLTSRYCSPPCRWRIIGRFVGCSDTGWNHIALTMKSLPPVAKAPKFIPHGLCSWSAKGIAMNKKFRNAGLSITSIVRRTPGENITDLGGVGNG